MRFSTSLLTGLGLLALGLAGCKKQDDPTATTTRELTYTVSTLAGTGATGRADGAGAAATFNQPNYIAVDAQGTVYVTDALNHAVRKITPAGVVSTLAGTGIAGLADGPGATAQFSQPGGIAVDAQGTVYVADTNNHCIRKITAGGVVSTWAGTATAGLQDGTGAAARFWYPAGVALDAQGNLYVADSFNNRIRKITSAGVVSTLAGTGPGFFQQPSKENFADGPAASALFSTPLGVAADGQGTVFVADFNNERIRKITPAGTVSTVAGSVAGYADGSVADAKFFGPAGVAADANGTLYVADGGNGCLRRISAAGQVSLLAGSNTRLGYADGPAATSVFSRFTGLAVVPTGTELYVADMFNHRIRKISGQ